MHVINKPKDTRKLYNKSYYKTLGENPEQVKSIAREPKCRGRNLVYMQAYSQCPFFIYIVFLLQ